MKLYIIGSLRNAAIPSIANKIREACPGLIVFDDWYAAGPEADDYWHKYELEKGHTYLQALDGAAAKNVFEFDKRNLDNSDAVLLVLPAGRSAHLELGYCAGSGKHTIVLIDDPERWDVMYQFASKITTSIDEAIAEVCAFFRFHGIGKRDD